ncbi:MAG: hypothetical protein U0T81_14455 [Saprospiraceae bacterium]
MGIQRSHSFEGSLPLTDSMRLIVDISDDTPGHLLEGAFDDFLLLLMRLFSETEDQNVLHSMNIWPAQYPSVVMNHSNIN